MIPKIIHHIWVGPKPLPDDEKRWMQTWKDKHPDWEFKFWTNDNLPELPNNCVQALKNYDKYPAFQADVIRYVVVLKYGGVYLDTDMECIKPCDHLFEGVEFVGLHPWPKVNWICNGFIGASPQHPVLRSAVESVQPIEVQRVEGGFAHNHFGPAYLTRQLRNYIGADSHNFVHDAHPYEGVRILSSDYWRKKSELCHLLHYARASWLKVDAS